MEAEFLRKIGFTEGEAKVYLSLVQLGESTIGKIGKGCEVSKSKIYDILDKLIGRGLVGYIIKNGTKYFAAHDPHMILELLDKKKEEIEVSQKEAEILVKRMVAQRMLLGQQEVAEVYEGFHGLKAIREVLLLTLKKGDELLVLGAPRIANEKLEAWFLDFHRRREERGIKMRIIYNNDAREFGAIRKKIFKLTKVRYFPNKMISPNWIDVFNDAVLFVVLLKEPITFVVRDKTLAQSFRSYFGMMWNVCKE